MTLILDSIRSNLKREAEGDWVPFPDWKGVSFNVSALTKPSYVAKRAKLFESLEEEFGDTPPPFETQIRLGALYAEEILHGWQGIDVVYSQDVAERTLQDPEHRSLFLAVEWCARQLSKVDAKFMKGAEKNSAPLSAGGSKRRATPAT